MVLAYPYYVPSFATHWECTKDPGRYLEGQADTCTKM